MSTVDVVKVEQALSRGDYNMALVIVARAVDEGEDVNSMMMDSRRARAASWHEGA